MENRIIFENEDVIIERSDSDDYLAIIKNKTDKLIDFGIPEFGLDANWGMDPYPDGCIYIIADETGYEMLDALEAGFLFQL